MKIFLIFSFQLLFFSFSFAQRKEPIDSFYYFVRNIQNEHELTPLSENHPLYKEPEAELTFVICTSELHKTDSYEITLGNKKETEDIKKWSFKLLKIEDKYYLRRKEKLHEIIDGKVMITEIVPATIYNRKMHLTLKKIDKTGKEINKNNKELN